MLETNYFIWKHFPLFMSDEKYKVASFDESIKYNNRLRNLIQMLEESCQEV